jgi:putative membrane protein
MITNRQLLLCSASFVLIAACNQAGNKDSEKVAGQHNEQKADSSKVLAHIEEDSKFVVKATSGVTMETELGQYAADNAVTPGVKMFGANMVKDHSKDKEALKKLASTKNITVPAQTGEDFQKHIDEIEHKKGLEFDKAYIDFMVGDHKEDISEFQKEARDGKDADIKAFAEKGIPVLQHHLSMAKSLNNQLNK